MLGVVLIGRGQPRNLFSKLSNTLTIELSRSSQQNPPIWPMNDGDCCRVEAEVILGFSQLQLHNILLTIDYFQKSRIPFLTKSPRMMEKSDIKNASLIICFEKSTYEKIQKGMVFSYKTSPISRFRSCLCFMFFKHLNRARN